MEFWIPDNFATRLAVPIHLSHKYNRVPNQFDRVRDQVKLENDKFSTKCTVKSVKECFSVFSFNSNH